jgi:hypothetical protein
MFFSFPAECPKRGKAGETIEDIGILFKFLECELRILISPVVTYVAPRR